ncbi:MAG TPA: chromosome segregation protein SMC, partial [Geobacteraceae bacterium]
RLEFQKKELLNLERHAARFTEELAALERQLGEAETELKLLEVRRGEFLTEAVDEEQNLGARERELEEMAAGERSLAQRLEEKRRELFALLAEVARYNNQQSNAAKRLEAMAERFERNRREQIALHEKVTEVGQRTGELQQAIVRQQELKVRLAEEQAAARGREEGLRADLTRCEQELLQRRDELSRKGSRLHSLQELEAQFAGYGQGVRTLMLADAFKGRFRGVIADFLETAEEYEAALEAVLGERLQYLLGTGDADILAAIAFLKESGGGRASFIAAVQPARCEGTVPAGAESLLGRVTAAEGCAHLIEPLLANTYLVADLSQALEFSRQLPGLVFATREGDLACDGGIVSGGSSEGARQGLIHKKREIKDLARDVELLTTMVGELEATRERCRHGIGAAEEELRELRSRQHQGEMQLLNCEKDLQRAREEGQRIEERLAVNELEHEQLSEEKGTLEQEVAASGSGRAAAEGRQRSLEGELEGMNATLTEKRQEIESVREAVTALKVRVAALKEKRESTLRACKRVEDLVRDLTGRIASHRSELEKAGEEQVRLVTAIAASDAGLRELVQREQEAERVLQGVRERYEAGAAVVREDEGRLKGVRNEAEEVRQGVAERSLKLSGANLQLHHLETSFQEKYRIDVATLPPGAAMAEGDAEAGLQRQQELQRLVDEMGEVNLTAIDEYRELDERHTFLTTQKADLEESLQSLQQAIQRINRTTRKRFMETFELVNTKFRDIFPRLFCGGRAELRLTEPENLLETGIDIIVQPPGKKLQNVTLLSGGEKALTAVALIFSIFLIKPSPFCLLDEVDAPLDDANIGRFNDMIREMTAFSQFILITHSKTTMAVADTLYGVTMEEPGVSKLVSVRLH